ncbi:MAG: RNA polymerase sigma factor [Gammaproteobacteria bacterium]|nr:RNA polymerase sigma factor [Gammaproteobacteria bacterium]
MNDPLQALTHEAYALAFQMSGKREDAMDILQDAATKALSHGNAPSRHSSEFRPWFFKVVRNRALDQLRRQQRFIHEPVVPESLSGVGKDNPEGNLEHEQLSNQIQQALQKLNFKQREIVMLKDYHGFNYAQIAEVLDIPKGSVMSRLHRARMALRNLLVDIN